jgi:uncharacterized protein
MTDEQLPIEGVTAPRPRNRTTSKARPPERSGDPLSSQHARSLVTSTSVIRDPLHHDIRVTVFERALIDTKAFQRLRNINQLAMVDSVYPGATHTRFLHSLGTLHVCSELITACNNSVKMLRPLAPEGDPVPLKIGPYAEFLARLVALLHDLAHVPFGHVFEREAQVLDKDEWEDPWRVRQTLDADSEFAAAFREALVQHFETAVVTSPLDRASAEAAANIVLSEIRNVLTAKGPSILNLRYPFVYDLVSNTICADLLDYVQRDMYFCGLTEGLATRFLNHLGVLPVEFPRSEEGNNTITLRPVRRRLESEIAPERREEGDNVLLCRVVLLQYRYSRRGVPSTKENILPEAIDLVRRRKLVAEKLYFHKTKLAATSMLSGAAHASGIRSAEPLWEKTDHEVLKMMLREGVQPPPPENDREHRRWERSRRLAQRLLDRKFFKAIYRVSHHPNIEDQAARRLWHDETGVYARFNKPAGREELIEKLELAIEGNSEIGQYGAAGAVTISCPNKNMQLKAFEMLVLPYPGASHVKTLDDTVRPTTKEEIDVIKKQHEELWRLEVFVDPSIVDLTGSLAKKLAGAINQEIGFPNEVSEYSAAVPMSIDNLIREGLVDRELAVLGLREEIKHVHRQALVEGIVARGPAALREQLKEWNYEVKADR